MQKALVWLRRDLRLYDNAALHHALKESGQVWLTFIFDTDILKPLLKGDLDVNGLKHDRRVDFIWQGIEQIDDELRKQGGGLIVRFGNPTECIPQIAKELGAETVFTNHDYEPSAIDSRVSKIKSFSRKKKFSLTPIQSFLFSHPIKIIGSKHFKKKIFLHMSATQNLGNLHQYLKN